MAVAVKAETVEERLQRLCDDGGGRLTPENVLKDAQNPDSPLHEHFEWDDSKAARQHRLDRARTLIRSVTIEVTINTQRRKVVAYVRDPEAEPNEQGYVETVKLRTDSDRAREALSNELKRSEWALTRARDLSAYFGLTEQTTEALNGIQNLQAMIENL